MTKEEWHLRLVSSAVGLAAAAASFTSGVPVAAVASLVTIYVLLCLVLVVTHPKDWAGWLISVLAGSLGLLPYLSAMGLVPPLPPALCLGYVLLGATVLFVYSGAWPRFSSPDAFASRAKGAKGTVVMSALAVLTVGPAGAALAILAR